MLILIVVSAAVALAAFVASYQKQVQAEEALEHQRSLENLRVLSVVPVPVTAGSTDIGTVNLTVSSLDVNPTTLTSLRINQQGVERYQAFEIDPATGLFTWVTVAAGGTLIVGGYDVVSILITDTPGAEFSFYTSYQMLTTSYIEVELYTALSNDFTQTFVPPTAIAVISTFSEFNGTAYVTEPELDGSGSFQPQNGTLVNWTWDVSFNNATCTDPTTFSGEKVVFSPSCLHTTYTFTLTVQNSFGLVGTSVVSYRNP